MTRPIVDLTYGMTRAVGPSALLFILISGIQAQCYFQRSKEAELMRATSKECNFVQSCVTNGLARATSHPISCVTLRY